MHWKKYENESQRLADMGITACWLPRMSNAVRALGWTNKLESRLADRSAPTKGSSPDGTGYDIYDLFDLGEFDQKGNKATKWGSKEDLLSAIKVAADKGIITYIDAVLNHK